MLVIAVIAALVAGSGGDGDITGTDDGAVVTEPMTTDDLDPPDQGDSEQDATDSTGAPDIPETTTTETTAATQTTTETTVETPVETTVETTSPPEASVPVPTTVSPDPPDGPTCRFIELDTFDDIQIELAFTNPLGAVESLVVTYGLNDGGGTQFTTGSSFVDFPGTEERFRISQDTMTGLPSSVTEQDVSCDVLDIEEGFGGTPLEQPAQPSGCEFVEVDSFDDIQVELTVTSPFLTTEDLRIVYALLTDDGIRFGDSTRFADLVGPGETVRIDEDTFTEVPAWTTGDDVRCEILGIEISGS